ncbi:FliI/YscN family ATPase [uncultured Brachyspira sp.]|uniref:FliI/YscN family ATPase n=1 Tax=uncultured Brachyspira sp. TaxID=221953 RepID=UPI002637E548|nr:FliI/YscN family ATPase [uncultured Brachyspira sp.]
MIKDENIDFDKEVKKTFEKYKKVVDDVALLKSYGKVKEVIGSLVISEGPFCRLGDMCRIYMNDDTYLDAEAIGFRNQDVLLATFGPVNGITFGNMVYSFERPLSVMCCDEILGTVLDARGKPLAGGGHNFYETPIPVSHNAVNPMNRPRIKSHIQTGVRAIDGLLTVGKGQRMAIMSGTGVGKSTLLSMIARNTNADVNVIALIGERRREVRDFIERDLGEEGLKRSILVVATSDDAPLLRVRAAYTATTIAEYFRDKGKNVMFMVDSVTRFALAQREIGLSRGEPPTTRGYTPSVFSELAKLLERTGTSSKGSITAFYNVLVEGDDLDEPITDAVRGILDGHIVLSRELANRGHFPAIDVNKSISRIMNEIVSNMHKKAAREFLRMSADYNEAKELIMIGGYAKGSMPEVDRAIDYKPMMDRYLQQDVYEVSSFADSKEALLSMFYSQEEIEEDLVNSGDVKKADDRTNISDNVEYANNDVVIL